VGQNLWEEIDVVSRGGNYGWNLREATHKFGPTGSEPRADLIEPIWEYDHETGKSITGGSVYRGSKLPVLQGHYVYADYVTGRVWALKYNAETGVVEANRPVPGEPPTPTTPKPIMTFGEDEAGEIYCSVPSGKIYRFEAK
jgi:glucose/arabinose dehydrogenase